VEIGNAITVNTPVGTGIHFFCHCSICGDGFENYGQLHSHEREKHHFMCNECEETFMTQSDLNSHVSIDHKKYQQCNECEESFICGDTRNVNEVSWQTEGYDCDNCKECERRKLSTKLTDCERCAKHIKKAEYMEVLQREHVDIKNVHSRVDELYGAQSIEMKEKMVKLQKLGEDYAKLKDEFEKLKDEFEKLKKKRVKMRNIMNISVKKWIMS
jgi:ribosomal protein L37AE/L43A